VDSQRINRYKAYVKTEECHLCKKKGHFKRDCPHASEKADDDAHVNMCKFTYSDNSSVPQLPTAAHTDREQMVMDVARALPVSPQLGEWELGLDSMTGVHVCGSERLASNIRKGRKITIYGVNGKLTTDIWCDLPDFKECAYVLQAQNLLSLALVSDQFEVQP
jgi:hypothetical protein